MKAPNNRLHTAVAVVGQRPALAREMASWSQFRNCARAACGKALKTKHALGDPGDRF